MNDTRSPVLLANLLVLVYVAGFLAWYSSSRLRATIARLLQRPTRSLRRDTGGPAPAGRLGNRLMGIQRHNPTSL